MAQLIDMTGQKFGRLTVVGLSDKHQSGHGGAIWVCKCECGNIVEVPRGPLIYGKTKSCGCYAKEYAKNITGKREFKHGYSDSKIYHVWQRMKARCYNPNDKEYHCYGGRGIKVCDEWLGKNGNTNFIEWALANGYKEGLSLDRIDNNGDYEPSNCRWTTRKVQQRNMRRNLLITMDGETKCLAEWCEIKGVDYHRTLGRYLKGYPLEAVFKKGVLKRGEFTKAN